MRPQFTPRRLVLASTLVFILWVASGVIVNALLLRRFSAPFPEPLPEYLASRGGELRLRTSDGLELGAWFVPAMTPRRAALVLHGFRASRSTHGELAAALNERDTSVLLVTQRAHGDSEGQARDMGFDSRLDVRAALDELTRREPGLPIIIVGTSQGAAAALYAVDDTQEDVAGWLLQSPYRDLDRAVHHRLDRYLFWPLPHLAYASMRVSAGLFLDHDIAELAPVEYARRLPSDKPVVFLSGDQDSSAPLAETREVRDAVGAGAELVVFPDAGHVDLFYADRTRFLEGFERATGGPPRSSANP